jgi:RTX calcium-binding nonapeptide repeat (4 copies)
MLPPTTASAAVTVGPDVNVSAVENWSCNPGPCTFVNVQHSTATLTVPFDGVVVRWRVQTVDSGGGSGPMSLKVLRQLPGGAFTGAGTSPTEVIVAGAVRTVPTRLPVRAGDYIGVNMPVQPAGIALLALPLPGVSFSIWEPALGDGEVRAATSPNLDAQTMLYNADVEPDCDGDGFGDETQDPDTTTCIPRRCAGKQATIVGSSQLGDVIVGTPGNDVIASVDGDDRVLGKGGNDTICGGSGRDRLIGGPGRDRLIGQAGKDRLLGQDGIDNLTGGSGNDTCNGGGGRDRGLGCETSGSIL